MKARIIGPMGLWAAGLAVLGTMILGIYLLSVNDYTEPARPAAVGHYPALDVTLQEAVRAWERSERSEIGAAALTRYGVDNKTLVAVELEWPERPLLITLPASVARLDAWLADRHVETRHADPGVRTNYVYGMVPVSLLGPLSQQDGVVMVHSLGDWWNTNRPPDGAPWEGIRDWPQGFLGVDTPWEPTKLGGTLYHWDKFFLKGQLGRLIYRELRLGPIFCDEFPPQDGTFYVTAAYYPDPGADAMISVFLDQYAIGEHFYLEEIISEGPLAGTMAVDLNIHESHLEHLTELTPVKDVFRGPNCQDPF